MGSNSFSDTSTSILDDGQPPIKKRVRKIGILTMEKKQSILNTYNECKEYKHIISVDALVREVSHIEGVGKSTIYRVLSEYKKYGIVKPPKIPSGRPPTISTAVDEENCKNAIRRVINDFLLRKEVPTLDKMTEEVKKHDDIPPMSRSTLHKYMKKINFNIAEGQPIGDTLVTEIGKVSDTIKEEKRDIETQDHCSQEDTSAVKKECEDLECSQKDFVTFQTIYIKEELLENENEVANDCADNYNKNLIDNSNIDIKNEIDIQEHSLKEEPVSDTEKMAAPVK